MTYVAWLIFICAAILEVSGDAIVRKGLRGSSLPIILAGCATLCCYGVIVNLVKWNFSLLFGVCVAVFAVVSILRTICLQGSNTTTCVGLAIIMCGTMVIQFGNR